MKDKLDLKEKSLFRKGEKPLIISGPCSAESEEQVMETALQLAGSDVKIFRAGIWKPRTRPDTFEGLGSVALPWIKRVKEETGMLTAVEVANTWHIKEALKYGVDILWLGARTTANPFAVQELADGLRGLDIPVFIKNPVNPDIELWIGAFERLNKAGIKDMAAIHRGFSYYGQSTYRNIPQWEIPIELKRRIPGLPIITDPSHICGNRDLLFSISQTAMDLDFDGLFIESHFKPENALSDRDQQITPGELKSLLDGIIHRRSDIENTRQLEELNDFRRQIDQWDAELLRVLRNRMSLSEKIGRYKREENITILQTGRWSEILTDRLSKARKLGMSDEFITQIFKHIHQESISFQNKVMN
ncbi:MAG: bifunctional 3-deoxy-7-phosphoheptulonate synthase/chorismate mutase type II [Bacteroidales bacterium]|jgi:chorismate mutase|nr:bifunctional 3-deoxy-7-phosphoheptulonate synthase/chorismate mutase type II [Bacteroidales bacterium]